MDDNLDGTLITISRPLAEPFARYRHPNIDLNARSKKPRTIGEHIDTLDYSGEVIDCIQCEDGSYEIGVAVYYFKAIVEEMRKARMSKADQDSTETLRNKSND